MKVYISKYRYHWISPYTILEKVCFWEKDKDVFYNFEKDPDHKYTKWVNLLDYFSHGLQKFLDFVHPRIEYVKIDRSDTWNMDNTLAMIALPMLKQLKENHHGSHIVDLEDVPAELRYTTHEEYDEQRLFDFYKDDDVKEGVADVHARWEWVLDEMIFAFESKFNNWEEKYHKGKADWESVPCERDENGKPTMFQLKHGPNHTYEFDYEGYQKENQRIQNGFRLFGKYYSGLWD